MRKAIKKIIVPVLTVLTLLRSFLAAVSAETVPMLTREYIQQGYNKESVNKNYILFIMAVFFIAAAILIPMVFFVIEKIKAKVNDHKKKTVKKK